MNAQVLNTRPSAKSREAPATIDSIREGELSIEEHAKLQSCEQLMSLTKGFSTFDKSGSALKNIRDFHLYRQYSTTFEGYCRARWGISISYAWRLIEAAERATLLPDAQKFPRPRSESQMRPFLKLKRERFPSAWQQVVDRAKGKRITSELIRVVVGELLKINKNESMTRSEMRPHVSRRVGMSRTASAGEIMVLLQMTKRHIEADQKEQAVAALERLEALLFRW